MFFVSVEGVGELEFKQGGKEGGCRCVDGEAYVSGIEEGC